MLDVCIAALKVSQNEVHSRISPLKWRISLCGSLVVVAPTTDGIAAVGTVYDAEADAPDAPGTAAACCCCISCIWVCICCNIWNIGLFLSASLLSASSCSLFFLSGPTRSS
jgi:hypothetical protein